MDQLLVSLSSVEFQILKQDRSRTALINAVKRKFDCVTVYDENEFFDMSFGHGRAIIKPEVQYTKQLYNNLKISVWKDDLTRHKADAVVNAANEDLRHIGGLALALSKAGGPAIQRESSELIKENGKFPTGSAVCTSAGYLPCKIIIHAVGPEVSHNPSQSEINKASDSLTNAIIKILKITDEKKLDSVAIPAVSSGIFNFPRALCADIIVETVMTFSKQRKQGSKALEVRLVNNDDPTVKEMERACYKFFTYDPMNATVQNQSQTFSQNDDLSIDLGKVTLYLKKGAIEDEKTDVIVNSTGPDLQLSKGMVSIALKKKAGWKMQAELQKNGKGGLGDIFKTDHYDLKCKAVYHIVCAHKDQDSKSDTILFSVVRDCLEKAAKEKFLSISFPAIGTGNLGFQTHEVSSIMINAVKSFAKSHQKSKLDVYFVIFPADYKTFKAFQMEMSSTPKALNVATSLKSTNSKGIGFPENVEHSKASPCITLYGETSEAMSEAETWIRNILKSSTSMTINNDHIMHFGQKDHEKLSNLQGDFNVDITEVFSNGNWSIVIKGDPVGVSCAALQVENMLCQVQEEIASSEKKELIPWFQRSFQVPGSEEESMYERKSIERRSTEWRNTEKAFKPYDIYIQKIEQINNFALKRIFELNQKRVGSPRRLYQRVDAQFCKLICTVGFQKEYVPPQDQKSGLGIYFTNSIKKAITLWPDNKEKYLYFFEAQVLTGKSVQGSSGLTVPPEIVNDPLVRYDSVTNGSDIFVIFNGQLALPLYLITCRKPAYTGV